MASFARAARSCRRHITRWVGRLLAATVVRVQVSGLEHLPQERAIFAANHLGHADPLLLVTVLPKPPEIIGLSDLQKEPIASPLVRFYGPIPVNRDEVDRSVLRRALAALAQGKSLLLFPEARISRTGALEPAREGVAYLAMKADVPIVPIAITGTERIKAEWKRLRRPHLTVTIAPPIFPRGGSERARRERRRHLTEQVMCAIAERLPPAYQGVYGELSQQSSDEN